MATKRKLPILNNPPPKSNLAKGDGAGGGSRGAPDKHGLIGGSSGHPGADDDDDPRPPWHWVGFGAVLLFAAWLPLAWFTEALKRRIFATLLGPTDSVSDIERALSTLDGRGRVLFGIASVGLPALAMIAGGVAAGYLVTRYGQTTTTREAALSGALAALVACVLVWASVGFQPVLAVIALILTPASWLGGRLGSKPRSRLHAQ